jgi:hypothetical protein
MKALKSKTIWFALALTALGVIEQQYKLIENVVPEAWRGLVFVGIGVVVAVLRVVTTMPLEEK